MTTNNNNNNNVCILTNNKLNSGVFIQIWKVTSVRSLIRQFDSGEFQWNVSLLQLVEGHWCSSFVGQMLIDMKVLTFMPHMDKSGIQVRSRPLKRHTHSIPSRFQMAWQNNILTDGHHHWLQRTNYLKLTWKQTLYSHNQAISNFFYHPLNTNKHSGYVRHDNIFSNNWKCNV